MNPNNLFMRAMFRLLVTVFALTSLTGCGLFFKKPAITQKTSLIKLAPSDYPVFSDTYVFENLKESIQRSLDYFKRVPPDREYYFGSDTVSAQRMIATLQYFLNFVQTHPSQGQLTHFINSNFMVYQSVGSNRRHEVLFTGYFEPVIQGSLSKSAEYCYPIYALPSDLIFADLSLFSSQFPKERIIGRLEGNQLIPYYNRREIEENNRLKSHAEIIAWTNDLIDLFFLQIQGSGKIQLDTGSVLHVHYQASNGHPYRSIGRLLIDEGKISKEEMSMQKIRTYLEENPHEIKRILNHNPSYVFFQLEPEGPIGSLQEKLTAARSIALDYRIFPSGALAYVETVRPELDATGHISQWIDLNGFVLNQDTGGAIRGPGRADFFWGSGHYAKLAAGHMQHPGSLFFLVLKPELPANGL
jgi:membrane-bound lytic murein transglycosylase A